MALVLLDRVQQTGTANTTVSFTLVGSVTGFQSFSVIGNTNTTYYSAFDASGNWEVGIGTYSTTGPTLTRTTILSSSNSGSAVTFSGTVNIFVTYPAGKSVNQDASGNVTFPGTLTFSDNSVQSTSARSGATVTSSAADITLTAASNQLQQVAMTAANLRVILPNATTYASTALGASIFVISNNGTYPFDIAETGGGRLFVLSPGQTTSISLSNNSASSSGWVASPVQSPSTAFGQQIYGTNILSYNPTDITSTAATGIYSNANADRSLSTMRCCALSSTTVVVAYLAPTTGYPTVVAGTISGTTITWGTPVTATTAVNGTVFIGAMSSTTAMLCYGYATPATSIYARGINVSGTTVTVSAQSSAMNTLATLGSICQTPFTSTTIGVGWTSQSINSSIQVLTHNGTSAPTLGTSLSILNTTAPGGIAFSPNLVCLSATSAVVVYTDTTSWYAKALTLSGTTFTAGTAVTLTGFSTSTSYPSTTPNTVTGTAVSATEALFMGPNGAQVKITVSGTTVSAQTYITTPAITGLTNSQNLANISGNLNATPSYYFPTLIKVSSTDLMLVGNGYGSTSYTGINMGVTRLGYDAATLAVGKGFSMSCNMPITWDICPLSSTQAFVCGIRSDVGAPATFYPTGQVVALNG